MYPSESWGCSIKNCIDVTNLYEISADVDGSNITSLLLCFFFLFMKPLIDEGKIYKAVPPLYLFNKKSLNKFYNGNEWAFDKIEYYELFNSIVCNNMDIGIPDNTDGSIQNLRKSEALEWMRLNSEYMLELNNLSHRSACDPLILEYVCWFLIISDGNEMRFRELLRKEFEELDYDSDTKCINGSFNTENVTLIVDKLFMKVSKRFMNLLSKNPSFKIYVKNKKDKNGEFEYMTIGEFLSMVGKQFNIVIEQRFKGLGEADPALLFTTAINPKQRKLIRMTIEDVKEAARVFEVLHGKTNDMREERRKLLDETEISYADIDN